MARPMPRPCAAGSTANRETSRTRPLSWSLRGAGEGALMDARRELRSDTRKLLATQAYLRGIRSSLTEQERQMVDSDVQLDPVVIVGHEKERTEDELQGASQMVKDIMADYIAGPLRAGRRQRVRGAEGVPQPRLP